MFREREGGTCVGVGGRQTAGVWCDGCDGSVSTGGRSAVQALWPVILMSDWDLALQ